jgi:hypothetical protein
MAPILSLPAQQSLRVGRTDAAPLTWWSITLGQGVVASPPFTRTTARGEITEIDLRTRAFVSTDSGEPGPPIGITIVASPELAAEVEEGDELLVLGTTRRRFFHAGGTTVARTEVEAVSIVKVGDRRRRNRLIDTAVRWIGEAASTPGSSRKSAK